MELELREALVGRQALYGLLARLWLAPPDAAMLAELRDLPGFAELLAGTPQAPEREAEALQVAYEQVFGRNVYPYESLYVDRELLLNTAAAERVAQLYGACDFQASAATGAPDHIGLELGLMAHLLAGELAALAAGDGAALAWARAQQGRCLHDHLAAWAPLCARAVARVASGPFYRALAELTTELVLGDLGRVAPATSAIPLEPQGTPAPPEALAEDELGLGRVVARLITPDEAGLFLSRGDMQALGRRLRLPVPIGDRFQMLRGLFEAAGQLELVAALLGALEELLRQEVDGLAALAAAHPPWAAHADGWLRRLAQGLALLDELRAQALAGRGR